MSIPGDAVSAGVAHHALDLRRARRGFDRAARTFDSASVLHSKVREELLGRLDLMSLEPKVVIDAGTATGHAARMLARRYPKALVIGLDSSRLMLERAARQSGWLRPFVRLCADAERLPIAPGSADLIVSSLMLPWCDLDRSLVEFRAALAPRGLLMFASLGPDTLRELREAWRTADERPHVHPFMDMHDVGDALVRAGFQAPVLDVERYTLAYAGVRQLAADLRATGAANASLDRRRSLTGRTRFAAMQSAYEALRSEGRLPATCEVVFGLAWTPALDASRGVKGESVSLADLKRELASRRRP